MPETAEQVFRAVVTAVAGGGARAEVPFDVPAAFGEARPPVAGTVNGVALRSRLAVYAGRTYLGLTRDLRAAAGVELGDEVEIVLRRDDAPRRLEIPPELAAALAADDAARARFDALSFTHRREYARWIAEAKRDETRRKRTARTIVMLAEGVKHP